MSSIASILGSTNGTGSVRNLFSSKSSMASGDLAAVTYGAFGIAAGQSSTNPVSNLRSFIEANIKGDAKDSLLARLADIESLANAGNGINAAGSLSDPVLARLVNIAQDSKLNIPSSILLNQLV